MGTLWVAVGLLYLAVTFILVRLATLPQPATDARLKELEAEWEAVFNQFRRLAGQITKTEALERPDRPAKGNRSAALPTLEAFQSREAILQRFLQRNQ